VRIRVDPAVCEANGLCEQIAPEVFHLRDDDVLQILQPRPPEDLWERAREAVERCPKAALSIVD
jgi:ferredoxin